MIKKLFYGMMAATMLFATSCQQDDVLVQGGEATISFQVSTPEIATRAFSEGSMANRLTYAVYNEDGYRVTGIEDKTINFTGTATVNIPLAKGNTYNVLFWAANEDAPYDLNLGTVNVKPTLTVDYTNVLCNEEMMDAFYKWHTVTVNGSVPQTVELRRPFAQLNIGTADLEAAKNAGVNVANMKTTVVVKTLGNILDFETGRVDGTQANVTFKEAARPSTTEEFPVNGYNYLAMNYLLVGADKTTVDVEFTYTGAAAAQTRTFGSIPVQRNYRTNIYGNLLTETTEFNVEIKPAYEDNSNNVEVWDGKTLKAPAFDAQTNTYLISNGAELAYIAQLVNGTLDTDNVTTRAAVEKNNLKGYTVKLVCGIDLGGHEWTPISMPTKPSPSETFQGTFDGAGYTINGLKVTNKEAAGLFGYVYGATIKNVTIYEATINSNHYAGGIVAWVLNNKGNISTPMIIDNCHVINSTITSTPEQVNGEWDNGDKVGGIVGYACYSTDGEKGRNEGAVIKDCSVKNTTIKAYRDFAGLVGYASYAAIENCLVENITLEQDLTHDYKAPETPTTFGQIIGRDGEGNTINGMPYVADGVAAKKIDSEGNVVEYAITSAVGLDWIAANVDENEGFEGKTIFLDTDIDLFKGYMPDGDPITTAPIGDAEEAAFKGTFDGNGHTIKNLYQNGWALHYEWGVYGSIGLFRELEGATVKNVTIEKMDALIEGGDISFIAGSATGDCVFENITIKESSIGTYNNGCGGIIGWSGAGNYTFKDIVLDEDVVLGGLWGSFDSSIGGIVGQAEPGATYNFENVTINCRIDAYNDCTASYDYYNYRMCGMIIGRCEETTTIDGKNYPDLSKYNLSFNNVVVNYGDWMNYHYCRKSGERAVRVEPGYAYGGIAADRDHTTDNVHCMECIPFDQLIGGDQYAVKGLREVAGVTVNYPASYRRAVSTPAALTEALGKGLSVVLDADVDFGSTQLAITGENQVVDLGGHALTTSNNWGGISLKNGAAIKNGTITHTGTTAAIKAFNGTSVENVTINATCATADKTVTGIAVQQGANVESIKNVTINGVSQGIEVGYQATVGLIENAVVNESNNGTANGIGLVINGGMVGKAKDCTFKGETYGITIHLKGVFDAGLELENCKVEGTTASIYAWDEKGISNTSGSLTLTYDAATTLTGEFIWDFEDECKSVVTLNQPQ